ncbi:enoyl-CoA hydratase/isomerase family protein [Ornithinimicrobium panacihumi]|uniref:enoyl-CoA hydratase/isomerase family protein n=1 Tax=Ornithinimicrobium panacihumi TaxID=2008449 RepID=UPI003F8A9844
MQPDAAPVEPSPSPVTIADSPLGMVVVIDRPERRNALTLQMWRDLGARVAEAAERTEGPIYLMGAGGYFCSGADLGALTFARTDEAHSKVFVEAVVTCLLSLHLLDREVVAVVEGGAAGGGIEIMAACDRRVAVGAPRLVFPFGHHGMQLDGYTRWSLAELLGPEEAERLTDGRHVVEIEESQRLGLFDEVHGSPEDMARYEASRTSGRLHADSRFVRPGESVSEAVARAAEPMLLAFPPHWKG